MYFDSYQLKLLHFVWNIIFCTPSKSSIQDNKWLVTLTFVQLLWFANERCFILRKIKSQTVVVVKNNWCEDEAGVTPWGEHLAILVLAFWEQAEPLLDVGGLSCWHVVHPVVLTGGHHWDTSPINRSTGFSGVELHQWIISHSFNSDFVTSWKWQPSTTNLSNWVAMVMSTTLLVFYGCLTRVCSVSAPTKVLRDSFWMNWVM